MARRSAVLCLMLLFGASRAPAQGVKKVTYESLLERVKKADPKVDFKALRMAYVETKAYNPYDSDTKSREAMLTAFYKKDYAKALEQAQRILDKNFLDVNAHGVAGSTCAQLGKADRAKFHDYVASGLTKSILSSGDGKTPETAYVVISTSEEYVALAALGLAPSSQALVRKNGHSYDRLEGVDDKKGVTVYFNIDIPMAWLRKSLRK